jgi:hypothetical protein
VAENSAPFAGPPGRSRPSDPAEKARRVALLLAALAGSAPDFDARLGQAGEDSR